MRLSFLYTKTHFVFRIEVRSSSKYESQVIKIRNKPTVEKNIWIVIAQTYESIFFQAVTDTFRSRFAFARPIYHGGILSITYR